MKRVSDQRRPAPLLGERSAESGACFPIGIVAEMLGVTEQTLRLYESHGLVKPARRARERYYCLGDVQWLECLRRLIHRDKISIEGVKRLLGYAPCWEILGAARDVPCTQCPVFRERAGGPAVNGDARRLPSLE